MIVGYEVNQEQASPSPQTIPLLRVSPIIMVYFATDSEKGGSDGQSN